MLYIFLNASLISEWQQRNAEHIIILLINEICNLFIFFSKNRSTWFIFPQVLLYGTYRYRYCTQWGCEGVGKNGYHVIDPSSFCPTLFFCLFVLASHNWERKYKKTYNYFHFFRSGHSWRPKALPTFSIITWHQYSITLLHVGTLVQWYSVHWTTILLINIDQVKLLIEKK